MKKVIRSFVAAVLLLCTGSAFAAAPVATGVDMYAMPYKAPARIATDAAGKLYVTDPAFDSVHVFANNGARLYSMNGIPSPLGIAADSGGRLYVSDSRKGSVGLYSGGALLYKLGGGDGEFLFPNDIALSANGSVYVTDSKAGLVKVYSAAGGGFLFSFGAGLLLYPTGIAVDDGQGEVFVLSFTDLYVRVYDLSGSLKRSIRGGGGMMGGKIASPLGIAVDATRIYITDSYHCAVAVYDRASGAYLSYIGNIGTGLREFMTPTDLALDRDGKMFVSNTNNQRIEVIGIDEFSGLRTDPAEMAFSVYAGGYSVTQNMNLTSVGSDAGWTASASAPWIFLSSPAGTTPSTVGVTVDPAGLAAGTYNELVTFITPSGTEAVLRLNVQVTEPQKILSVSPLILNLIHQSGASTLPSGTVMISSSDIPLSWTATAGEAWLSLDKGSGITPDSLRVAVKSLPTKTIRTRFGEIVQPIDSASGSVVVNAANAQGSPVAVQVNLRVVNAGNIRVNTNLEEAGFTIKGPESLSGSGKTWTAENVRPGTYSITFSRVSGYRTPQPRSFTVRSGKVSEITVSYAQKPIATHILAGAGAPDGATLTVLTTSGVPVFVISPFATASGVKAIAADLDGDGVDEMIAGNRRDSLKIFDAAGNELASKMIAGADGLEITAADLDGDGRAEIVAGYVTGSARTRVMTAYSGLFAAETHVLHMPAFSRFRYNAPQLPSGPVSLAAGDINGDGMQELVVASATEISGYRIHRMPGSILLSLLWKKTVNGSAPPTLGTGDMDDDGIAEIAVGEGASASSGSSVKILKGDGTDYGITINSFGDLGYAFGVSVALGDIDADGKADVVTGAGPGAANEAVVRLYDSSGQLISSVKTSDGLSGVNAALGRLVR